MGPVRQARSWSLVGMGVDAGNDRHAWTQQVSETVGVVNRNFDGDTLNDLREIARGIVRRQKRELRTRTRGKREHMPAHSTAGESIHRDVRALADAHVSQLRFFVI